MAGLRAWAERKAAEANARSKWRTYSKRKRLWAAVALTAECLVLDALLVWLLGSAVHDQLGVATAFAVGAVWFIAMVWALALLPERSPGVVSVWFAPGMVVTILLSLSIVELFR